uniref:Uncharacterized protein n=1 Tax=Cacopsylla melanoneura TaxID=428564 RepID=A0A8D8WS71_9HEMI
MGDETTMPLSNGTDEDYNSSDLSESDPQSHQPHTELSSYQPDLSFEPLPVPAEYREKEKELKEIVCQKRKLSLEQLRNHAKSPGGFITDSFPPFLRRHSSRAVAPTVRNRSEQAL